MQTKFIPGLYYSFNKSYQGWHLKTEQLIAGVTKTKPVKIKLVFFQSVSGVHVHHVKHRLWQQI